MIEGSKRTAPATLIELFALFEAQGPVRIAAAKAGLTPLRLAQMIAAEELSATKRANRRYGRGRRSYVDWARRFGMDPLDALIAFEILSRLGEPVRPTRRYTMIADHARARDTAFCALTFGPHRPGSDDFRKIDLEKLLKAFFETIPPAYSAAYTARVTELPADVAGLKSELRGISSRVAWPPA